ncbi:hypothetical protein [Dyella flagellata]|uniref:hypothetical protein n=1 Tax=Dyella flagellata TaxID=1867833 RepID=UPI0024E0A0D3|nr:hypothetical protein [Dyella flagellata]
MRAEPAASAPPSPALPSSLQQIAGNQTIQRLRQDMVAALPLAPAPAPPPAATPPNVDNDNTPLPAAVPAAQAVDAATPAAGATASPTADPAAASPSGAALPATPQGGTPTAGAALPNAVAGTPNARGAATAQTGGAPGSGAAAHPGGTPAHGNAHGATGAGAGAPGQGGAAAGGADSGLASAEIGDLALIDEELAEHQRWSSASQRVGAAESTQRAAFIAEQAGAGFTEGVGTGFLMGLGVGVGTRAALRGVDYAMRRFGGRIAGGALRFSPLPGVGAMIGGAFAAYGLATRDWEGTGRRIGRIGQGGSTYERIANTIDGISEIIDVTTNILNVIAGICGAIAVGLWVFAVATAGVLSPLAGIMTEVALAIGAATMILDGINSAVLHPVGLAFRALHEFTTDADPTQVEADGADLQAAAAASGGALGGLAGGKLAHVRPGKPSPHPPPRQQGDHPNPPARGGQGPTVTATPPVTDAGEHAGPRPAQAPDAPSPAQGSGEPVMHVEDPGNVPPASGTSAAPDATRVAATTEPAAAATPAPTATPAAPAAVPAPAATPTSAAAPAPTSTPAQGVVDRNYGRGAPPPGVAPPVGTPVPGQPERAFIPASPELNRPWMYDEQVPNRGALGQNVQRDHVISQQKIRDQMTDPHGVLRRPDLDSLTVLAETGKATATDPARPHTQATFIDPQADVPEIQRLRGLGRPANWTTDIIEPSRDARLRSGYDPASVDAVILDQTGRLHEQYRNNEVLDALTRLEAAETASGRRTTAAPDTDLATLHGQLDAEFGGTSPAAAPAPNAGAQAPSATPAPAPASTPTSAATPVAAPSPASSAAGPTIPSVTEPVTASPAPVPQAGTPPAAVPPPLVPPQVEIPNSASLPPEAHARGGVDEPSLRNPADSQQNPASLLDEILAETASRREADGATRQPSGAQILDEILDESSRPWHEASPEERQRRRQMSDDIFNMLNRDESSKPWHEASPEERQRRQQMSDDIFNWLSEHRQSGEAPEPQHVVESRSGKDRYGIADAQASNTHSDIYDMAAQLSPTRSNEPLTPAQQEEFVRRLVEQFHVPRDKIRVDNNARTHVNVQTGVVTVGPNVFPRPEGQRPPGLRNPANAALSDQAALGHEVIGHLEASQAGQTRSDRWHEELQASARAGLYTPDLPPSEVQLLLQDAAGRRPVGHDETIYVYTGRNDASGRPLPPPSGPGSGGPTGPVRGARPQDGLPKVIIDPSLLGPTPGNPNAAPAAHPLNATPTSTAAPSSTPPANVAPTAVPSGTQTSPATVAPSAAVPASPATPSGAPSSATPAQPSRMPTPRLPPALTRPHPAPGTGGGSAGGSGTASGAGGAQARPRSGNAFVRGFREGLEPVVIRVNPTYTPPPVTPQQIIDIQNEILQILAARAQAENEAARMARERSQHQANTAPITRATQEMTGAQTAVSAHQAAVQRRQQANQAQQQRAQAASSALAGAPNRMAGLSVITIPLGAFLNLTQYSYLLPEGSGVRRDMEKMDHDSRHLLAAFGEMETSVNTQNAASPGRQQALQADAGALGTTAQQANPSREGFVRAGAGATALQQANANRIAHAGAAQAQARGQAAVLGNDAEQRQATVQTLSDTLRAWAQTHRAQRQAALQQTEQRIQAQGGRVIARSEG